MNAKVIALLTSIIDNDSGYIAFESEGWCMAFAPANNAGYINFKAKMEDWSGYKNAGYLKVGSMEDPTSWELRFPGHSEIYGEDNRSSLRVAFRNVLMGIEFPGEAPKPRGKPPGRGAKSAPRKGGGGGKRKATDNSAAMDSIAQELAAMREEMAKLREAEAVARENLRKVLNGEKIETGMTVSGGPPTAEDRAITLRNRAAALLRSAISHCELGEERAALAALNALNRIRKGN